MIRAVVIVALLVAGGCRQRAAPEQPIAFNHQIHVGQQKVPCVTCHRGALTQPRASLPAGRVCLACHMKPQGTSPREPHVRELASSDKPIPWIQVTRNPGHVYFSHRAHVSLQDMACETCHGDVTRWTSPPTEPNPMLTEMDVCMSCHREHGASNECETCHR